jgi:hypothetical protein
MARPTKLNAALLDKLEEIADDQWTIKAAADAIDIGESTWRRWEADVANEDDLAVAFRALAARVRAGAGAKLDDLAWGAIREVLEDPNASRAEKVQAATNALRLRTAHRVELTGAGGGPIRSAGPDLSKLSTKELRQLRELTAKAEGSES